MKAHTIRSTSEALGRWLARSGWRHLVPNVGTVLIVALLLFAARVGAGPSNQEPVPNLEPVATIQAPTGLAAAEPLASTNTISYQGRLTDASGNPINTPVSLTFRLYDVPSGGSPLWTEVHSGVPVNNGLFSVLLGSINVIPSSLFTSRPTFYLGVTVGADPEMTPREQIASSAYAFAASNLLDGATGGALTLGGNLTVNGTDFILRGRNSGGTGNPGRALVDAGPGAGLVVNYNNDFGKVTLIGDTTVGGQLMYTLLRQDNTSNSQYSNSRIQTGWGYIHGDTDETDVDKTVTFPSSFSEIPIVLITPLGLSTSRPDTIDDFYGVISREVVLATNVRQDHFTAIYARNDGSDFEHSYYYGFAWIAIGR
jgi:hypothetical protein